MARRLNADVCEWRRRLLLMPADLFNATCEAAAAAPGYDASAHMFYERVLAERAAPEHVTRRAIIESLTTELLQ